MRKAGVLPSAARSWWIALRRSTL